MSEGGRGKGGDTSESEADSLLRAVAHAPERQPDGPDPTQVAHFRILGRLGQGGMGVVYRAVDETLRRTVALKLLRDTGGDAETRQRFLREARSAAAVTHPNVAIVHQVGEADGRPYIAMELVKGESLRARLGRGRLDVATARELAVQMARGLAAAHAEGIVHRDFKPENVMITPEGVVKLLDFGLAKLGVERVASGPTDVGPAKSETLVTSNERRVMGTAEYMSPEQAVGKPLDVQSDVFSFGVVLYEMLSGTRPFQGLTTGDVLMAIVRDPAPALRKQVPGVDGATEAVVTRCLAKAPAERFANGGEIVAALGGATTGSTVRGVTGRRWARTVAVMAGMLIACALVAAVGVWGMARHEKKLAPAPASSASAPHKGIAITDYPPPKTNNPEAAAAYASGLQHLRDAEEIYASDDFGRAAKLDPAMAAADLRAVLYGAAADMHGAREYYAAAMQHRAALDERDRLLLAVAEAALADPPLPNGELLQRVRAVVVRFPEDAEATLLLGDALFDADVDAARAEARAAFSRALELDPQFSMALRDIAVTYEEMAEPDRALELAGRCLQQTPSAGSCLRLRAQINVDRGRCDDVAADARRLAVIEPNGHRTYELLAAALAARNAPVQTVRDVLARRAAVEPDELRRRGAEIQATLWTATLVGDLETAETTARAWGDLNATSVVASDHAAQETYLFDVIEERGDVGRALHEAEAYERRSSGWTGVDDQSAYVRAHVAFLRRRERRVDEVTFRRTLDDVFRDHVSLGMSVQNVWMLTYLNAATAVEAMEAVATMPDGACHHCNALFQGALLGRLYLLAGKPDVALPFLRRGVASCAVLPTSDTARAYPIWWMRDHEMLGEALEATGDKAGACQAYGVVLDRWKNAKPHSVTLDKARTRSKALGCDAP